MGLFDSIGSIGGAIAGARSPLGAVGTIIGRETGGTVGGAIDNQIKGGSATLPGGMTTEEMQRKYDMLRAEREKDLARGRARGVSEFENQLGKIETDPTAAQQALLAQRKQIMDQGLGSAAFQAARETRLRGLGRNEQEQQRALASQLQRAGLRGGAAAGQLGNLMRQQQGGRTAAEQELLLQNVAQKQQGMNAYQDLLTRQEDQQRESRKFNLGQIGKEKFGTLTTSLAEGQLGAAERGAVGQQNIGQLMAQAAAQSGGGKK